MKGKQTVQEVSDEGHYGPVVSVGFICASVLPVLLNRCFEVVSRTLNLYFSKKKKLNGKTVKLWMFVSCLV